jgi:hypothetical protein
MGNQYGVAGQSTTERAEKIKRFTIWMAVLLMVGIVVVGILFYTNQKVIGFFGGGTFILIYGIVAFIAVKRFDKYVDKQANEAKKYWKGARGEEQVGEILSSLGNDYVVINDVMKYYGTSPAGNIDHIVYDHKGNIFVIETKSNAGTITSDGKSLRLNSQRFEKDIIKQTFENALWLKGRIEAKLQVKAWITPILVFTNAYVVPGKPIRGVNFMNKSVLLDFVKKTNASSAAGRKLWEMRKKEKTIVEQGR